MDGVCKCPLLIVLFVQAPPRRELTLFARVFDQHAATSFGLGSKDHRRGRSNSDVPTRVARADRPSDAPFARMPILDKLLATPAPGLLFGQ